MFRPTLAVFREVVNKGRSGGIFQRFPCVFMAVSSSCLLGIGSIKIVLDPYSKMDHSVVFL